MGVIVKVLEEPFLKGSCLLIVLFGAFLVVVQVVGL